MSRETPDMNRNGDSCASCMEKRPGRTSIITYCMASLSPFYKQNIVGDYKTTGRMEVTSPVYCGHWLGAVIGARENLPRKEDMP